VKQGTGFWLGELLDFSLGEEFQIGAAHQFFFTARAVFEEDYVHIIEGGELLLDLPDELFVPDTDPLSLSKVHEQRVGGRDCIHYPKNGLRGGPKQ
jgi:hypothetical protein